MRDTRADSERSPAKIRHSATHSKYHRRMTSSTETATPSAGGDDPRPPRQIRQARRRPPQTPSPAKSGSGVGRISVSLTGRAAEVVRELGAQLNLSDGDVVRRAIGLLEMITADTEEGAALLLRQPNGETERVRFLPSY